MTISIKGNNISIEHCAGFIITKRKNTNALDLADFAFKDAVFYPDLQKANVVRIRLDGEGKYEINHCRLEFVSRFEEIMETELYESLI